MSSTTTSTPQTQPPQGQPIADTTTGNPTMQMVQWMQRIQNQVNFLTAQNTSLQAAVTALQNPATGNITGGTG
jgi:hypothetical protein